MPTSLKTIEPARVRAAPAAAVRRIVTTGLIAGTLGLFALTAALIAWPSSSAATGASQLTTDDPIGKLSLLGKRLQDDESNIDVLLQYASQRARIPTAKQTHLRDAIQVLRRGTQLAPENPRIHLELANLYQMTGQPALACKSAERALRLHPDNEKALLILADALISLGDLQKADQLLMDATCECEQRWRFVLLRLRCMIQRVGADERLIDTVREFDTYFPGEREIGGLMAFAFGACGDRDQAIETLRLAVRRGSDFTLPYARFLAEIANELNEPLLLTDIVESSDQTKGDPFLSLLQARRSWESGNPEGVIKAFDGRQLTLAADPEACLLLAVSLAESSHSVRLMELLEALESQLHSEASDCWLRLIKLLVTNDEAPPADFIRAANLAGDICPASPIVSYVQASAFFLLGEYATATQLTAKATRVSPQWVSPYHLEISSSLLSGNLAQARELSRQLIRRFPNDLNAEIGCAISEAVSLPSLDVAHASNLIRWTSKVRLQQGDPRNEEVAMVRWLALLRLGRRDEAEQMVRDHLGDWENLPRSQLIRLMVLRRQRLLSGGKIDRGTSPGSISLSAGDDLTNEISLIDSLGESVSDAGSINWRIVKARKLLSEQANQRDAAKAALLLRPVIRSVPDHVDGQLLMGIAMIQLQDHLSAIEHWLVTVERDPRQS